MNFKLLKLQVNLLQNHAILFKSSLFLATIKDFDQVTS